VRCAPTQPQPATPTPTATQTPTRTAALPPTPTSTRAPALDDGLAIIGDSSSDEYRGSAPRGGPYQATTFNWAELLVRYRGVNLGAWGDYPEPRRTGYAANWARSGATTDSVLSSGQHRGVAEQIRRGEVRLVFIWVGGNDIGLTDLGTRIREGTISPTEQDQRRDRIVGNIAAVIRTLRAAGDVRIVLAPVPDLTAVPVAIDGYGYDADPIKQARLRAAIAAINDQLRQLALREGVVFHEVNQRLQESIAARMRGACVQVSSACLTLTQGAAPTNMGLDAYWHPGTVVSGLVANAFMTMLNEQFGTTMVPFTDTELLQIAGITP
ncbi:MAG: GDSL-type esterase/lipase family protein, partial [Roseiflexaceae bacterium]|nr:GDSL-type esterase/lipase family protein [Roseiflexaceae bacterium]